ncbi:hypothetical protein [Streptomyces sodiiphilus]|uniref:hypothetical protein n=1 Tax=Streptomyces sodiiphilus TaxID=226217 RepID=UPI0031D15401
MTRVGSALRTVLRLLLAGFFTAGLVVAPASAAAADESSRWVADYGPPDPPPEEWNGGERVGTTPDGNWCVVDAVSDCHGLEGGELPGTVEPCSEGSDCSAQEREAFERGKFEEWKELQDDQSSQLYADRVAFLEECLTTGFEGGGTIRFQDCANRGALEFPEPVDGPLDWFSGQISAMAANALEEAAMALGTGVLWMLEQFTSMFDKMSTIDLAGSGIGRMLGLATVLSALIAVFLMSIQIVKAGLSQQGEPLATALVGLAKYGLILSVYVGAVFLALEWADAVSDWIITESFADDEGSPSDAMKERFAGLFAGLSGAGAGAAGGAALLTGSGVAAGAVGVVIVISILVMLAIGALWLEMLMRQAGIMLLVVAMPIVLAGQMADATKDWWPRARNALIALILLKPVIVLIFGIGFGALAHGEGLYNVLVGLLIFVLAAFAWPVLAKFLTFTPAGEGSGSGTGLISALGSSGSSMFGGARHQPVPQGPGAAPGGAPYSKALEAENNAAAGGRSGHGARKGFWGKAGSVVGLGVQVAAVGKDALESTAANVGANAGLGSGAYGGRHAIVMPARGQADQGQPEAGPAGAGQETPPPAAAPSPGAGGTPAPAQRAPAQRRPPLTESSAGPASTRPRPVQPPPTPPSDPPRKPR